jgi:hypothetical protein
MVASLVFPRFGAQKPNTRELGEKRWKGWKVGETPILIGFLALQPLPQAFGGWPGHRYRPGVLMGVGLGSLTQSASGSSQLMVCCSLFAKAVRQSLSEGKT